MAGLARPFAFFARLSAVPAAFRKRSLTVSAKLPADLRVSCKLSTLCWCLDAYGKVEWQASHEPLRTRTLYSPPSWPQQRAADDGRRDCARSPAGVRLACDRQDRGRSAARRGGRNCANGRQRRNLYRLDPLHARRRPAVPPDAVRQPLRTVAQQRRGRLRERRLSWFGRWAQTVVVRPRARDRERVPQRLNFWLP